MWGRQSSRDAARDAWIVLATEFKSHVDSCKKDKGDIEKRLDKQDQVSDQRHAVNVAAIKEVANSVDAVKDKVTGSKTALLTWALTALIGVVGFLVEHLPIWK